MFPRNMLDSEEGQPFNMGIATLMRIDNCLKMLSAFQKVRHRKAVVRHLRELYKELYPFIKQEARALGSEYLIRINVSAGWEDLDNFDFWLRDELYKHGLLMAKGSDPTLAVMRMM